MEQIGFGSLAYEQKKVVTKKERFLQQMNLTIPINFIG